MGLGDMSRRDSFITHRAFCDALAEESARVSAAGKHGGDSSMVVVGPSMSILSGVPPSSPHGNNNLGRVNGGGDSLASIGGGGSMRPGLPSSMATGLGRLGEGGGGGGGGLSLLPPRWGQAVGNAPATSGAAPRLSLWLGSGPGQGLPPPGSQHVQLFVSWITCFFFFFFSYATF